MDFFAGVSDAFVSVGKTISTAAFGNDNEDASGSPPVPDVVASKELTRVDSRASFASEADRSTIISTASDLDDPCRPRRSTSSVIGGRSRNSSLTEADKLKVQEKTGSSRHTIEVDEAAAFSTYINNLLEGHELVAHLLPLDPMTDDVVTRCQDGLLLADLIHEVAPGAMNLKVLSTKKNMNLFQKHENNGHVLNAAKEIGCQVVNIGSDDLTDSNPIATLGLLWQILRVQLLMKMNLEFLEENYPCFYAEAEKDIFKARDNKEQLLLKWANHMLRKTDGGVAFHSQLTSFKMDPVVFNIILHELHPETCTLPEPGASPLENAELAIANAAAAGCRPMVAPADLCSGNAHLTMGFLAQIFNTGRYLRDDKVEDVCQVIDPLAAEDPLACDEEVFKVDVDAADNGYEESSLSPAQLALEAISPRPDPAPEPVPVPENTLTSELVLFDPVEVEMEEAEAEEDNNESFYVEMRSSITQPRSVPEPEPEPVSVGPPGHDDLPMGYLPPTLAESGPSFYLVLKRDTETSRPSLGVREISDGKNLICTPRESGDDTRNMDFGEIYEECVEDGSPPLQEHNGSDLFTLSGTKQREDSTAAFIPDIEERTSNLESNPLCNKNHVKYDNLYSRDTNNGENLDVEFGEDIRNSGSNPLARSRGNSAAEAINLSPISRMDTTSAARGHFRESRVDSEATVVAEYEEPILTFGSATPPRDARGDVTVEANKSTFEKGSVVESEATTYFVTEKPASTVHAIKNSQYNSIKGVVSAPALLITAPFIVATYGAIEGEGVVGSVTGAIGGFGKGLVRGLVGAPVMLAAGLGTGGEQMYHAFCGPDQPVPGKGETLSEDLARFCDTPLEHLVFNTPPQGFDEEVETLIQAGKIPSHDEFGNVITYKYAHFHTDTPEDVVDGFIGMQYNIFKGLSSGVSMMVASPGRGAYKGYRESGSGAAFLGFWTGMAKGVVGGVGLIGAGVVHGVSQVSRGVVEGRNVSKIGEVVDDVFNESLPQLATEPLGVLAVPGGSVIGDSDRKGRGGSVVGSIVSFSGKL